MKIVIGSESFAPNISGVAVSSELLAENLAKNGHEVFVFAPSPSQKNFLEKNKRNYKIFRLRSIPNPFRKGFRVAYLPKNEVMKKIREIRPDIIHLQDPTSICSALKSAAKKFSIPLVITNHFSLDYVLSYVRYLKPLHPLLRRILKKHLAKFYNHCDFVICPTETVKKDLCSWKVKTEIEAVSNGVDLERFFSYSNPLPTRIKYHLPVNPLVLYVGRIDKDKNIDILIEAIPEVLKSVHAHFVFVGFGDEAPKMKKLAEKQNILQEISFLGWVDHGSEDFPIIYQLAELFVIPSAIETQSIVTLEAMAAGLPIVAAKAGALPELVKNNKNGFLVNPEKSKDFALKILKILKNKKLKNKMSKESLKIVSSHQITESFQKTIQIYEKVLKNYSK